VTIHRHWLWFSTETGHRFLPLSVVLVRCRCLQDLLILQGTTKSTRKKKSLELHTPTVTILNELYYTYIAWASTHYYLTHLCWSGLYSRLFQFSISPRLMLFPRPFSNGGKTRQNHEKKLWFFNCIWNRRWNKWLKMIFFIKKIVSFVRFFILHLLTIIKHQAPWCLFVYKN